ncbi:LOW QUALITY PROTEIN: hypothetical protein CRUP_003386 [Coryphaenoides rupestris]|nr:LOW QUALITY PROTEIN: hypothetical protein CRUP_003386 [Coryphaenoides rupestris]
MVTRQITKEVVQKSLVGGTTVTKKKRAGTDWAQVHRQGPGQRQGPRATAGRITSSFTASTVPNTGYSSSVNLSLYTPTLRGTGTGGTRPAPGISGVAGTVSAFSSLPRSSRSPVAALSARYPLRGARATATPRRQSRTPTSTSQ